MLQQLEQKIADLAKQLEQSLVNPLLPIRSQNCSSN